MAALRESQNYENPELWRSERYQDEKTIRRFAACAALIPSHTRSVLDVGTGNGAFLAYLEGTHRGLALRGLERSMAAVRHAVCTSRVDRGSHEDLPYAERSFDMLSALEVIEHLPYGVYQGALVEIERVARSHILVSVPYRESTFRVTCPHCGCKFHPYCHMRRFQENVLRRLFRSFQLVVFRKLYVSDYVFGQQLSLAYRFIFNRRELFPDDCLCPQCGFHRFGEARCEGDRASEPLGAVKRGMQKIVPRRKVAWWIVALYERTA